MSTRLCQGCGFELTDNARFCPKCGKAISVRVCQACGTEVIEGVRFCQNCGKEVGIRLCQNCGSKVTEGVRFCQNCGQEIISTLTPEKKPPLIKASPKKQPKMRWQYRLAIVLPIFALLAVFIFSTIGNEDQTTPITIPTPAPLSPAQESHNRGRTLFGEGKYDEAIAEFDKAISLDPQYALAYCYRGMTYSLKEQHDLALADFNTAIELNPESILAYCNRGDIYFDKEQYELAIADYSKALELDPEDSSVWNSKGVCLSRLDRYEEALECYDKALQIDPNYVYARNNKDRLIAFMAVPADTTPPSVIGNLVVTVAGNGSVNLGWDRSTASDFEYYNVYASESAVSDVTGMTPRQQLKNIDANRCQLTGLKSTTKYYFAVTAVDKSGNENKQVIVASIIPTNYVTLEVPALVSTPEAIRREFAWEYGGINWVWEAELPGQLYQTLHDKTRPRTIDYSIYVTHSLDDGFFKALAGELMEEGQKLHFTNEQMVELVVLFTQIIPYTTDIESTGRQEYPRYPIETLVENKGDCEDLSILLAQLLSSMNYDAILLEYRGEHMAVGIADTGSLYGKGYEYNGKSYFYTETTATGWKVGDIPPGMERAVYVWELVPTPSLGCERYSWPNFTGTMPLSLTIYNDGTAPALGVKVYVYLEGSSADMCYADAWATVDIPQEETVTVTLQLKLPSQPIRTRVRYAILHKDRNLAEGSSDWQYFTAGG